MKWWEAGLAGTLLLSSTLRSAGLSGRLVLQFHVEAVKQVGRYQPGGRGSLPHPKAVSACQSSAFARVLSARGTTC